MERPVIITLIVAVTVVLVVAIGAIAMVLSSRSTPEAVASASVNEVAPAPVATAGSVPASSAPASSPQAVTAESAPAETQAPSPAATTATPQATLPPVTAAPAPTPVPVQPVAPPAPAPTRTPAPSPTPIVCPTGGLVLRYVGMTESWLSQASLASDSWSLEATATLTNETGQTLSSVAVSGITIRTQQVIFTGRNTVGLFPTSDAGRVLEPGASLQLTGTSQVSVATDADYSEEARRTPAQRAWEWESVFVSSQFADNAVRSACPRPQVIAEPF